VLMALAVTGHLAYDAVFFVFYFFSCWSALAPGGGGDPKNFVTWARSPQHKASGRGPTAVHAFGQDQRSSDRMILWLCLVESEPGII